MLWEPIFSKTKARINERVKTDANGVAAKMDELISLLKGFGGSNVVVKTI